MWILELIIIMVLIGNNYSFLEILGIMIIFIPLFYGFVLPMIMSLFKETEPTKDNWGLGTYIPDEIENWNINAASEADIQKQDKQEEKVEKLIFNIISTLYTDLIDWNYQKNIDHDIVYWEEFLEKISFDLESTKRYNMVIWISYQEMWHIRKAQDYFLEYSKTLDISEVENDTLNEHEKRFVLLLEHIRDTWFKYKFTKD